MTGDEVNNLLCLDRAYTYLYLADTMLVQAHMAYASAYTHDPDTDRGIIKAADEAHRLFGAVEKEYTAMREEMKG